MSFTAASEPTRTAPLALWRVARAFLNTLYALFGAPEDVAGKHVLTRAAHAQLASWLACAEAMLRRLLLIEAAAFAGDARAPDAAHSCVSPAKAKRVRKAMSFEANAPETWRVSFRCFVSKRSAPSPPAPAASSAKRGADRRFPSAWPLAERYEALTRVFNDPAPFARRLARRLRAAPRLVHAALRAPDDAEHRVDRFDAMGEAAEAAWRQHFSSG